MTQSMKKVLIWMGILFLLMQAVACAEPVEVPDAYVSIEPEITRFSPSGDVRLAALDCSFYMSDDEIWYCFSPNNSACVIQRYNRDGSLLKEVELINLPISDQRLQCVARVGDRLLVGITDGLSLCGTVIVFGPDYQEIGRVALGERTGILSMKPAPDGILCSGFQIDGGQGGLDHFYIALVGAEGNVIFENNKITRDSEIDRGFIGQYSLSCAGEDGYYAVISMGQEGRVQFQRTLTSFGKTGEVLWEIEVPEKTDVRGMTAAGQTIYLYGVVGDLDEYDCLTNEKAFVSAYNTDGAFLWQRVFIGPEKYFVGAADESGCFVLSKTQHAETEAASISADGEVRQLYMLNLPVDIYIEGMAVRDDGSALISGRTTDNLILFEMK